jgi:hypothetical protein
MPLLPNASVKTKYDFTRSRFEWKRQFEVSPTTNILEEGSMLTRLPGPAGNEVVQLCHAGAAVGTERACGIALISRITATTFADVRNFVIPAVPGPYTIQLPHAGLVDYGAGVAEAYVWDNTAAVQLAVIAPPGPPVGNQVMINTVSGLMTFPAALAGDAITVNYKWNLTAVERDLILRQSHVNRGAEDQFNLLTVGFGNCVVYTSMYDCHEAYPVGAPLYLINGGFVSSVDPGASIQFGHVVSPPTPGDPYLGWEYISPA